LLAVSTATSFWLLRENQDARRAIGKVATENFQLLVLDGTFASLQEVASVHYPSPLARLVVGEQLNSAAAIANYHDPLLQLHGDQDRTVPLASAERLFAAAHEPKTFRLPGHDHNTPRPREFFAAVRQLLRRLGK
jgi:fermentation-respiration switch protein FrsA (DUF1100 family)